MYRVKYVCHAFVVSRLQRPNNDTGTAPYHGTCPRTPKAGSGIRLFDGWYGLSVTASRPTGCGNHLTQSWHGAATAYLYLPTFTGARTDEAELRSRRRASQP
jgi:hypothetical protein